MSDRPLHGAFPHQHQDPRGLVERIEAQIRERIEEAIEMAGLKLLVDLRARDAQPAPVTTSEADRQAFQLLALEILTGVRSAFDAELDPPTRDELARAESRQQDERERLLAGQVCLARRLPDYWQRVERHQAAYVKARLESPAPRRGWRQLFG